MLKPCSPLGSRDSTSIESTRALCGPRRNQSTSESTRSSGPSSSASTVPSGLFRTQPATSSDRARERAVARKPTACTKPPTTTRTRRSSLTVEALGADERDEPTGDRAHDRRAFRAPDDDLQLLPGATADRNHDSASDLELLVERGRDLRRGGSDGDRRKRSVPGVAERAVADVDLDAAVAGGGERLACPVGERGQALDRVHVGRELREHGRLVAGTGADVEHPLVAARGERLADAADQLRLGGRVARYAP